MEHYAAHDLLGRTLKSGWKVIEKVSKSPGQTGAMFSVGYIVDKKGEPGFLKAFDFGSFLSLSQNGNSSTHDINFMDVFNDMTAAFVYERDLSKHCKNKHVTKVAFVKEASEEIVPGYPISVVPYLIFDLADGDVRKSLNYSDNLDYAWRLKSLHDVAVGLKQLHQIEVSHQDLKPSNILVFKSESKLADLGRSMCRSLDGPYNKMKFSGDYNYAPPEIMYGYSENDWIKRVFATDCYLLGSLIVFYFGGISMSALLMNQIPEEFVWYKWKGSFEEIKPYLEHGFAAALQEFENSLYFVELRSELKNLVEILCHPFPEKRGHPKSHLFLGNKYDLERIVTMLDVLRRKAEVLTK